MTGKLRRRRTRPQRRRGIILARPKADDIRIVGFYVGRVVFGLGLLQLVPLALALLLEEWHAASALAIGASLAVITGRLTEIFLHTRSDLTWSQGMVTVAVSWVVGSAHVAVTFYLSGHFGGFLDATFDAMSGLTTSGLTVIQDLDHVARSVNLLRHLTQFAGGQGIIVVVLSLFATAGAHPGTLYVGEAREERILPNVIRTARFIFLVALAYLVIGTALLTATGMGAGLQPGRAIFHGVNVFMAGFDTGGFAPMSTSIAYYHSFAMELVVVFLMIAGALSFGLHYHLWRGRAGIVGRHIEVRTLAFTLGALATLALIGLGRAGTYADAGPLFRKGFFTLVSAHTGTGFAVNAPGLFVSDWGPLAPAAIVGAMALGGMAGSTAGGFKAIRVGLAAKAIAQDIRRVLLPPSALIVQPYETDRRQILRDEQVRAAVTTLLLYLIVYVAGGIAGLFYGLDFEHALFESTSATANVGLSVGIVGPDLPIPLKLVYLVQMWVGRLEFMAVFVLVGFGVASIRGRR